MTPRAAAVVNAVRARVEQFISVSASPADALKICFLCSTVESDALLEFSHKRVVSAEARTHGRHLALTPEEFDALLEDGALNPTRELNLAAALAEGENDAARLRQREAIETALRLTLAEERQRALWESSPRTRTRVTLATLRQEGHVGCMQHALGNVLQSDLPRIEDLRHDTENSGIDIISVDALITTVCTQIAAA